MWDRGRWRTLDDGDGRDALIATQQPSGAWTFDDDPNLYSTQNAVRALAGEGFSADPPRRANPADARLRAPAVVAPGTVTPHALAIDHGAGDVRFCRVDAPAGAALAAILSAARTASAPAGCVTSWRASGGAITEVNGAAGAWRLELDRRASEPAAEARQIGFGDTIGLRRAIAPGSSGAPGPAGPTGPAGPAGPRGPRPVVRCLVRKAGKRVHCRITAPAGTRSALRRGGQT